MKSKFIESFTEDDFNQISSLAAKKGWHVDYSNMNSQPVLTFITYMDYDGQFHIEVESVEQVIQAVEDFYYDFDPDEETYLWLGSDGHGINGAPYHIRDINCLIK